jgi:hypothetical protein
MFGHTVVEMSSKPSLPMASSAPLSSADFAGTGAEPGGSALWGAPLYEIESTVWAIAKLPGRFISA